MWRETSVMRPTSQLLLLLLLLTCVFLLCIRTSSAADKLQKGQNLTDGEMLVSAGGSFTLGFFSPGVSNKRYLGIWFSVSNDTVYWVANRENPLSDTSGMLVFNDAGSLVLLDGSRRTAWSADFSRSASTVAAQLLESGNLVVRNGSSDASLWQSFDHPSDTLLPGMKLGKDSWSGTVWQLISWRSADDPSPGDYRRTLEKGGLLELVVWHGSVKTYRTGPWNGRLFNGVPEASSYADWYPLHVTNSTSETSYGYDALPGRPLTRIVVNYNGVVERRHWVGGTPTSSQEWHLDFRGPTGYCDPYASCGAFGYCKGTDVSVCDCLPRFSPASPSAWNSRVYAGGCRRDAALDCPTDGFKEVPGVKLPDTQNASVDTGVFTLEECKARCYANCSCLAYATAYIQNGTGCIIWADADIIVDVLRVDRNGQSLYLRLSKSEFDAKAKKMSTAIIVTICAVCAAAAILLCLAFVFLRSTPNSPIDDIPDSGEPPNHTTAVPFIDLETLKRATDNFSKTIGQGAFGVVYEGQLSVAVKKMKRLSSPQPNRVLRNFSREVEIVCNLRHENLVRLLAYCDDGDELILVYEYMQNKSLNLYIFGEPSTRASLSWEMRLEIIRGIAKGVCYLHGLHDQSGASANIVHNDLKPANVLLDQQWRPKIADFGTAKLFRDDETGTRTQTVVYSVGYAAPEKVSAGEMTPKCDVFSFGVVLLEIISGRENNDAGSLISEARGLSEEEGRSVMKFLDAEVAAQAQHLSGSDNLRSDLRQCIDIGLLCVQETPDDRPAMSAVVDMLSQIDQP